MHTEVIGIDHIYLSVTDLPRAEAFYDLLLCEALGFRKAHSDIAGDPHVHYYNRHFGFSLRPARSQGPHDPYAPGLHHFCLRVDGPEDVDRAAAHLGQLGINCTAPALYPQYAPDYYAVFVDDPDGMRLEITNFRQERRERLAHWEAHD